MRFIADLHVHSHFSRATSRNLDPEHLNLWARKKGISVIGTGDFTHPGWIAELEEKLIEAENGLFKLRPELARASDALVPQSCQAIETRFLFSGEISCIYKKGGKTRKLHHLILLPDIPAVHMLNKQLDRIGNITSDGRPILGLDSRDLLEIVLGVSDKAVFIPAHIWTPWFSLFGSKSGFDSLDECFGDLTGHIHALETGLSSDPPMNRLFSDIDHCLLVSNSDAHSPPKLGREANILDTTLDFASIQQALTTGRGFLGTIEFFPEEGKYHLDGHRKCQVKLDPEKTMSYEGICPSCGKPLTIGVLHRVHELSDRNSPELSKDFRCMIPLPEILSEILGCGPATKRVNAFYEELLMALGPELHILMDASLENIEKAGGLLLARAIERMRQNRVIRQEGYDGEYGIIRLFEEKERHELLGQITLFAPPKEKNNRKRKKPPLNKRRSQKIPEVSDQGQSTFLDPILDTLNPAQRKAVLHRGDHLLITAGPGTGKTLTLTRRIAQMIRSGEANPQKIIALTFTNKAANEMKERLRALLPEYSHDRVQVSTFHGFCLEILKNDAGGTDLPDPFTICSEMDAENLARQVISENGKGKQTVARFLKNLPQFKRMSLFHDKGDLIHSDLFPIYKIYQEKLRNLGMLDLDDLEVETQKLLRQQPDIRRKYA
ncbi:UvrD-helicase domain-containing protein, partial [Thermodesulfobacteriota bacterium]